MVVIHSQYREAGHVEVNAELCNQCGQCVTICPSGVLEVSPMGLPAPTGDSAFDCIACGHCMMVCPEGAIAVTGRGISPDDLVTLPPKEERASADALAALMAARRSVRRFKSVDVEPELLERIVEMASSAPMGIPPWDIGCVVVRGQAKVQELAGEVIDGYRGFLKLFRPWVIRLMGLIYGRTAYEQFSHFIRPLAEEYVSHYDAGKDALFYRAPAVLIFHNSPYSEATDAMVACTYAMLAAESLGLGSTMIGGAAPIMQRNKPLCRRLGIPEGNKPSIALIVGHPVYPFKKAVRRRFSHLETVE